MLNRAERYGSLIKASGLEKKAANCYVSGLSALLAVHLKLKQVFLKLKTGN